MPGAAIGDRAASDRMLWRHNVVGVFRDVDAARDATARLEDTAGDGVHVQCVGFEGEHPWRPRDSRAGRSRGRDRPGWATDRRRRRAIGALAGAIVIGGLAYIVTGDGGAALASAVGAALILGVIGAQVASFPMYEAGDAWRQTFQPTPPVSIVAVLTDDPDVVEPAAGVLHAHGALSVELRDGAGERVPG